MSKLPSTSTSATIPAKKTNHYIDKAEMLAEVVKSKAAGAMTDKLARMILLLAEKYSHHHWFIGYSYREDMVADAVLNLVHSALKFDPEKSNTTSNYSNLITNSNLNPYAYNNANTYLNTNIYSSPHCDIHSN
jgi:DNA-directed RNA polymerase specialized sigma subunit